MSRKKIPSSISFSPDLYDALNKLAQMKQRSFSFIVNELLEKELLGMRHEEEIHHVEK